MASADGFSERVSEAWDAEGLSYDEQDMISERLDDMGRGSLTRLAAFQAGINVQVGLDPAGVQALGDAIVAHVHTGAAGGGTFAHALLDNATFSDGIYIVVQVARAMLFAPKEGASGTTGKDARAGRGDDAEDDASTHKAYEKLQKLQNRTVELTDRLTCVGTLGSDLTRFGFLNSVPSLKEARVMGVRHAKSKATLNSDSHVGVEFTLGDIAKTTLLNVQTCRIRARQFIMALLAILSREISGTVFQGRDVGWVDGPSGQVRLLGTAERFEALLWRVVGIPCDSVDAFVEMFDRMITHFMKCFARGGEHPDEIITAMLETKNHLFAAEASSPSAAAVDDTVSNYSSGSNRSQALSSDDKTRSGEGTGLCLEWIKSGKCTDKECKASHRQDDRSMMARSTGGSTYNRRGGGNRGCAARVRFA